LSKKVEGLCRQGYKIAIPCNWVKDGICGIDLKRCVIIEFMEKRRGEKGR
jgi:hypothetical protein